MIGMVFLLSSATTQMLNYGKNTKHTAAGGGACVFLLTADPTAAWQLGHLEHLGISSLSTARAGARGQLVYYIRQSRRRLAITIAIKIAAAASMILVDTYTPIAPFEIND